MTLYVTGMTSTRDILSWIYHQHYPCNLWKLKWSRLVTRERASNKKEKKEEKKIQNEIWIENIFFETRLSNVDEFFWENK